MPLCDARALVVLGLLPLLASCGSGVACGGPTSDFPYCGANSESPSAASDAGTAGDGIQVGGESGPDAGASRAPEGLFEAGSEGQIPGDASSPPNVCDPGMSCGNVAPVKSDPADAGVGLLIDGPPVKLTTVSAHLSEGQPGRLLLWFLDPEQGTWLHLLVEDVAADVETYTYPAETAAGAASLEVASGTCEAELPLAEGVSLQLELESFETAKGVKGELTLTASDGSTTRLALDIPMLCDWPGQ